LPQEAVVRLSDLLQSTALPAAAGAQPVKSAPVEIAGLSSDSRDIQPGYLFAALPGTQADGRAFVAEAQRRGAAAIVGPPGTRLDGAHAPVPLIIDDNPRRLFAQLAARFYGAQPDTIAAVTGTNGKTSTVSFLTKLWRLLGRRAASLGTLGIDAPGVAWGTSLTTPDPVALHRALSQLVAGGIDCLAMEASSHGLAQFRLDGVRIAAAAFTNLTRDHLDYHGSIEDYLAAKLRLFDAVMPEGGQAVINADADYAPQVIAVCNARRHRVLTFGDNGKDIALRAVEPTAEGQRLKLDVLGKPYDVMLPLVGRFQASNALCALGLAIASGSDAPTAVQALARLDGVRGRLELVARHPAGAPVYVDYAHTPDALFSVLGALRPHVAGRLAVVFGCGGERDAGKRPEMGRIATVHADRVIITDDNPRSEDPAAIRAAIAEGAPGAAVIGDRRQAINEGLNGLRAGDALVIAGKGHERGQVVGKQVLPFDDAEVARTLIAELGP
jgi:UDP-N-acetylmuramoyl-L-alanyl-D-glutamate--2,6-diaminopimelate ligase